MIVSIKIITFYQLSAFVRMAVSFKEQTCKKKKNKATRLRYKIFFWRI